MIYFLLVHLRLAMAFLALKGDGFDTQGTIWEKCLVNTDPRTGSLKPKLLPGCEIRELLAPGWIALL